MSFTGIIWVREQSHTEPDDGEDANPEKFPSGLGDETQFADARHEEPGGERRSD